LTNKKLRKNNKISVKKAFFGEKTAFEKNQKNF